MLGTALVTFTISVYGHATIVKLSGWFTWILLACIAVLGYDVLRHAQWDYLTPNAYAVHGIDILLRRNRRPVISRRPGRGSGPLRGAHRTPATWRPGGRGHAGRPGNDDRVIHG